MPARVDQSARGALLPRGRPSRPTSPARRIRTSPRSHAPHAPTVARLDRVVAHVPYNLVVQPAPRWHVEIVPRLGVLAGFEQTTGVFVSTLSPERGVAMLRDAPGQT